MCPRHKIVHLNWIFVAQICKTPTITSRQRNHTTPPKTSKQAHNHYTTHNNAKKPTITYSQHAKYLPAVTPTHSLYPQTPRQVTVHHTRISYRELLHGQAEHIQHTPSILYKTVTWRSGTHSTLFFYTIILELLYKISTLTYMIITTSEPLLACLRIVLRWCWCFEQWWRLEVPCASLDGLNWIPTQPRDNIKLFLTRRIPFHPLHVSRRIIGCHIRVTAGTCLWRTWSEERVPSPWPSHTCHSKY